MNSHNTTSDDDNNKWLAQQKREDVIEEILYNSKKTNLTHLKRIGWTNGFPDRFRSPSWQLLLHYLPVSKSKRKSKLQRKRISYHRHITQHYFEFDFCLTDRKLPSAPVPVPSPGKGVLASPSSSIATPSPNRRISLIRTPSFGKSSSKRRNSLLLQKQTDQLFEAALMPLFSQPPKNASSSTTPNDLNGTREDSLLLQIRHDVNQMVKVPTNSKQQKPKSSSSSSSLFKKETSSVSYQDIHGESATTTNRLFANLSVKGSLERILYLWSIHVVNQDEETTYHHSIFSSPDSNSGNINHDLHNRYVPGMVDIVYPLYLTILQGYIWDTHISTTLDNPSCHNNVNDQNDDDESNGKEEEIDGTNFLKRLSAAAATTSSSTPLSPVQENGIMKLFSATKQKSSSSRSLSKTSSSRSLSKTNQKCDVIDDKVRQKKIQQCLGLSIGKGLDLIPEEIMDEIEADTFWCLENMMNAIQDYRYNDAFLSSSTSSKTKSGKTKQEQKPNGLQKMMILIEKTLQRVDPVLYKHLKSKGVEFHWFTFRWMNTLHVRELNEKCIVRLWDTCFCEEVDEDYYRHGSVSSSSLHYFTAFGFNSRRSRKRLHLSGFLSFQVYICVALLHQIRDVALKETKFDIILYQLRNLYLDDWGIEEITMLLSQAFVWKETFRNTENQLLASATAQYGDDTLGSWINKKCHWPPRKEMSRPWDSVETVTNIIHSVDGKVLSL